ncbi:MAG: adenylyltransferase/cytidyltransferase family protein [Candidatus Marinimicrobia bacterium]|jgi:rfaE bifunctional protein nucleotidyltransferase chain/domain|nr:adenylyltransferase/cytidyltransferase family protein [Candidatus Neomarinimicrobiota bacterium]MBT4155511.1 adenylyltransferase/cytidyltransferase family protein [Candidatus Neomarinimicrobiota bacterium]MBT4754021.1 adenylyltransferase/cytidyltransferase family protein [Candidatus Neomarinimicrobiota bacterium]MBT5114965.1 adenylyltransferase/cytidyltransferase family protein [Candidatus Neomarinimicrobiota bacterium]MBT5748797.1 adenylyltransferase/cytidyltransferase family protein [Candi|tara:strand:- start:365 stop:835 length:471 start_codon:yes stop_codon:yes gene_type:complete
MAQIDLLIQQIKIWQNSSKTIVFTNGCFDLLHRGHIDLLQKASQFGDYLIVGLNSDRSVNNLKGEGRPIESETKRTKNLMKLESVSHVIIFDEETPLKLIQAIRPHILVKGGDYSLDDIAGSADVISRGGSVKIISLTPGYSTTQKVNELKREGLG